MKIFLSFVLSLISIFCFSQSIENSKLRIKELSSEKYFGRGYLKNGANKAADYLAKEFKSIGLLQFDGKSYQQKYFIEKQNVFSKKQFVAVDGKELLLGDDYIIGINSGNYKTKSQIFYYSDTAIFNKKLEDINDKNIYKDCILIIDTTLSSEKSLFDFKLNNPVSTLFKKYFFLSPENTELLLRVTHTKALKTKKVDKEKANKSKEIFLDIKKERFPKNAKEIEINVKSKVLKNIPASNVIGYIEGEIKDTFYVFSAHYDHVGGQGKTFYVPGAQDNASGCALVLDIADYYSKHKPKYSIAFMLFSGEEAGLLGSNFYVENPLFDLEKIKLLINLDLVGTGDQGFTVVNGKNVEYKGNKESFNKKLFEIVLEKQLFDTATIEMRDMACNSDHCPFDKKNVPAIFIYTKGGKTYYHNRKDTIETLTFSGYLNLFTLLTELINN